MTKQLALVSARNGFGHSRRLFSIAKQLVETGLKVEFIATSRQINVIRSSELGPATNANLLTFRELSEGGIDMADFKTFSLQEEAPSLEVLRALESSCVVLSDNSFWASEYHDSFYLLGHFDWFRFWIQNKEHKLNPEELQTLKNLERLSWSKVKIWFRTVDFSFDPKPFVNTVTIPLIRYSEDLAIGSQMPRTDKIWVAFGTTGLHTNMLGGYSNLKNSLEYRESYLLHRVSHLPIAVIGRPGLGTIRDCLSSGTIFIPFCKPLDVELNNNVETLKRLELLPHFFSSGDWMQNVDSDVMLEQIDICNIRIQEYWLRSSANYADVTKIILEGVDL
jgi:hypothetical protein